MKRNQKPEFDTLEEEVKGIYHRHRAGFYRPNLLLTLEKRQMFDGAGAVLLGEELLDEDINGSAENLPTPQEEAPTPDSTSGTTSDSSDSTSAVVESNMGTENTDGTTDSAVEVVSGNESSDRNTDGSSNNSSDGVDDDSAIDSDLGVDIIAPSAVSSTDSSAEEDEEATEEVIPEEDNQPDVAEPIIEEEEVAQSTTITDEYGFPVDFDDAEVTTVVYIDTTVNNYEALLAGVVEEATEDSAQDELELLLGGYEYGEGEGEEASSSDETNSGETTDESIPVVNGQPGEMYFVDGTLVVLLNNESSQIDQITDNLEKYSDLAAIHVVSHGAIGQVRLGNETLSSDNLSSYASTIKQWGQALSENGDILLYGCNVGATGEGQGFLDEFAALTKADVAASNDVTGASVHGGDWDLEVETGAIEADQVLTAASASGFMGILADKDGDGIDDSVDIDDDNDGILDTVEVSR